MSIDWDDHGKAGEHGTVRVRGGGREAHIDAGIAELVEALWTAGVNTDASCQGGEGDLAHLDFSSMEDASLFLALAVGDDDEPGGLSDRSCGSNEDPTSEPWEWLTSPSIIGRRAYWTMGAFFPPSDIPELLARVRKVSL